MSRYITVHLISHDGLFQSTTSTISRGHAFLMLYDQFRHEIEPGELVRDHIDRTAKTLRLTWQEVVVRGWWNRKGGLRLVVIETDREQYARWYQAKFGKEPS